MRKLILGAIAVLFLWWYFWLPATTPPYQGGSDEAPIRVKGG